MSTTRKLPSRLHHTAYTTKDMEKTRAFYEEVVGLPLVATWSESDELFGKVRTYCHCFFGLADGGALAFFQFADTDDERTFSPPIAETPFHHIALKVDTMTQEEIELRIKAAGYGARHLCWSTAIAARSISKTPTDAPRIHARCAQRRADRPGAPGGRTRPPAVAQGDHTSNNVYR
jgi:catechol 2,3-dioxygenase-like lactoylglutathione lyase family enzyme